MSGLGQALWNRNGRTAIAIQRATERDPNTGAVVFNRLLTEGPFDPSKPYVGFGSRSRYHIGFNVGPLTGPDDYSPEILEAVLNHPLDPMGLRLGPNFKADDNDKTDAFYVKWKGGSNPQSVWGAVVLEYRRLFPAGQEPAPPPAVIQPPVTPPPPPPTPAKLSPPEQRVEELREILLRLQDPADSSSAFGYWLPSYIIGPIREHWSVAKPFAVELLKLYRLARRKLGDPREIP